MITDIRWIDEAASFERVEAYAAGKVTRCFIPPFRFAQGGMVKMNFSVRDAATDTRPLGWTYMEFNSDGDPEKNGDAELAVLLCEARFGVGGK